MITSKNVMSTMHVRNPENNVSIIKDHFNSFPNANIKTCFDRHTPVCWRGTMLKHVLDLSLLWLFLCSSLLWQSWLKQFTAGRFLSQLSRSAITAPVQLTDVSNAGLEVDALDSLVGASVLA